MVYACMSERDKEEASERMFLCATEGLGVVFDAYLNAYNHYNFSKPESIKRKVQKGESYAM